MYQSGMAQPPPGTVDCWVVDMDLRPRLCRSKLPEKPQAILGVNTMTNETPDTLKQLLQILEKQGTANDDITGNSRNHWRKIATKGLTRGRFKREPCVICKDMNSEMHHYNYRKPYEITWLCQLHHRQLHALEQKLKRDKQWPIQSQDASNDETRNSSA
jgi:hypothetical protein